MRAAFLAAVSVLVTVLGLSGLAQAQNWVRLQGTIQAVDCQTGTLVLRAPGEKHVMPVSPTARIFVNSAPIGLCTLRQYVGSYASVAVTAVNSQLVVGRIDVLVGAAAPPPPPYYPYPAYYPYPYYYGPPIGIGIGIVIGGGFHHYR
jgi:hypothetical protein